MDRDQKAGKQDVDICLELLTQDDITSLKMNTVITTYRFSNISIHVFVVFLYTINCISFLSDWLDSS